MRIIEYALSATLLSTSAIVFAQTSVVAPLNPAVLPSIAAPTQAVLRAQTPIMLKMSEELTTKKKAVRVGQRFNLEVAEPVTVSGVVVIPTGAAATGEVTQVRNKGMWGKSGYIGARLVHVRVGDRTIRLAGSFDDKGVTGTGGVVASIALVPLAGFFTTGTSAMLPMGAPVKGFIDEDVPLAMQTAVVAPLSVQAPPAPLPVAAPNAEPK
jgi:hypothetical protein